MMSEEQEAFLKLRKSIKSGAINLRRLLSSSELSGLSIQSQCELLLLLSHYAIRKNRLEKAQEATLKGLELVNESTDSSTSREQIVIQASLWNQLGTIARKSSDIERAERFFNNALKLLQGIGHEEGQSSVLNNLGNAALQRGDFKQAKAFFLKASKKGERDHEGDALSQLGLANCEIGMGNLALALKQLEKIEDEEDLPIPIQAKLATVRGNILAMKENWNYAAAELAKAREFLDSHSPLKLIVLQNLGLAYSNAGKFHGAIQVLEEYLTKADVKAQARNEILILLGTNYLKIKNIKRAEECFTTAAKGAQTTEMEVSALLALAQSQATHSPIEALESYRWIENILEQTKENELIRAECHELAAEIEFSLERFDAGFKSLKRAQNTYELLKEHRKGIGTQFKCASVYAFNQNWPIAITSLSTAERKAKLFQFEDLEKMAQRFKLAVKKLEESPNSASLEDLRTNATPTMFLLNLKEKMDAI